MVDKVWKAPNGSTFYKVNDKGRCEKIEKIEDVDFNHCDYAIKFRMENGEEKTFYYDYDEDNKLYLTPKEAILGNICKFEKLIKGLELDIECLKDELEEYKEKLKVLNQQRGSFND